MCQLLFGYFTLMKLSEPFDYNYCCYFDFTLERIGFSRVSAGVSPTMLRQSFVFKLNFVRYYWMNLNQNVWAFLSIKIAKDANDIVYRTDKVLGKVSRSK